MSKEIIINVTGGQSRIAIVEDGELVELYIENPENVRTIGDIYLGRVRRILPGIKAAFVDIGQKQDAFLHFSDLSDNLQALLELSEGKVPDWSTKSLPKAPKQDEDSPADLELETPEEQRAARRRRDLKRTHGKSRRGRGQKSEKPPEAKSEPAPEEPQAEQKEQADAKPEAKRRGRSDSRGQRDGREQRSSRGRGRSRREQAVPQPPETEVVPDTAPEILPPDAVAEPPSRDEAPSSGAPSSGAQADTQSSSDDKPKRRRGRRGGRGRNRGRRQNEQPTNEQQQDQPTPEAQSSDGETTETPKAEASSKSSRSRRGGSGRSRSSDTEPKAEAEGAENRGETDQPPSESSSEQSKSERKQKPQAARPDPKPEVVETAASSSRFVIDLTSKTGRIDRVEEEEEEEERSSRSRGGRRRGGRRRGRSRSGSSSSTNSGGGKSQDDKSQNDKSQNGRSSSRGGSGRSGSSNRSGSGRGGSSRGGSSRGGSSNGSDSNVRPEKYLKQDQKLVVKITKEPISSKGPRVSTDVSLAGRFLVLIPQADYVAVSKKIESSKERRRLRALARSLLPESFGLIVRTVAENRDAKALNTDLRLLLDKWKKIEDQLKEKPKPPKELHQDVNMVSSIIRDLFSEDYDRIVVDDPTVHRNVKNYVQAVAPQMAPLVKLHKSKEHVFRTYKIDRDVRAAFESRVSLPGGGYLFIEHTEAMHVVDVNSGRAGKGLSQEENALRVNLESARAIAKQLRLRDLGGIICVDFIDMRSESARRKLTDELKKEFRKDRAVTKLLPMSDFGVVQITRQRLRPSITTTTDVDDLPEPLPEDEEPRRTPSTSEREPAAEGETLTASEVVAKLEQWLATYRAEVQEQHRKRPILIRVHPFLAAYLQRGVPSAITRWRFRTWLKFRLDVDDSADPLSFSVRDEKSGKNLTRKYDSDLRETA